MVFLILPCYNGINTILANFLHNRNEFTFLVGSFEKLTNSNYTKGPVMPGFYF